VLVEGETGEMVGEALFGVLARLDAEGMEFDGSETGSGACCAMRKPEGARGSKMPIVIVTETSTT